MRASSLLPRGPTQRLSRHVELAAMREVVLWSALPSQCVRDTVTASLEHRSKRANAKLSTHKHVPRAVMLFVLDKAFILRVDLLASKQGGGVM